MKCRHYLVCQCIGPVRHFGAWERALTIPGAGPVHANPDPFMEIGIVEKLGKAVPIIACSSQVAAYRKLKCHRR